MNERYSNKTQLSQDGRTIEHVNTFWGFVAKMSRVLCEDGRERTVILGDPDTFFTIPGRTHARGKTVTGFVSYDSNLERFTFKATGKHRDLLTN